MKILAADHILPISSEPIRGGAIAIDGDSIIAAGKASDLRKKFPDASFEDFGEAALLPGFVNCHSHLEVTAMRGLLDSVEHDFSAWLLKLNVARASLSDDEIQFAATAGAIEGARAGVTCFGDIGRFGKAGLEALKKTGLRGVLFQETEFSPENKTASDDLENLRNKFLELRESETHLVRVGLSPHSPYTVSRDLFERIAGFALETKIRITIHAAESVDEKELLEAGKGFFVSVYEKYAVEWESPRSTSIKFLESTGILETSPLLAHCVTVSEKDIEIIRNKGATVAHCPKSNAKFGHGPAPFEKFLDAGISVGLGSDSVASNNVCDILEEARFAALSARNRIGSRRLVSAREALEAATLGGAKALGLDQTIGSLELGKQADIAVISLSDIAQQPVNDIYPALVFASNSRNVAMTMVAGIEVYRNGTMTTIDEAEIKRSITKIGHRLS